MSDAAKVRGPVMICATDAMKPPPVRVGRIAGRFSLPRTAQLSSLIAGGVGAIVGAVAGLLLQAVVGIGIVGIGYAVALGVGAGLAIRHVSPLRDETLLTWLRLIVTRSAQAQPTIDGERARVAVGIALVPRGLGSRRVPLQLGAVDVDPSNVDDRGVPVSQRNRNLDRVVRLPSGVWGDTGDVRPAAAPRRTPVGPGPWERTDAAGPALAFPHDADDRNPWSPTRAD